MSKQQNRLIAYCKLWKIRTAGRVITLGARDGLTPRECNKVIEALGITEF